MLTEAELSVVAKLNNIECLLLSPNKDYLSQR